MTYVILVAFVVQASVGASLAVTWWHGGRRGVPTVSTHMAASTLGLGLWIAFVVTGNLVPAWSAFAAITVGNTYGDKMLLARVHRQTGSTSKRRNYPVAVAAIFRGRMPRRVAFHALFAGVVYFSCLGVCIASTVAAT
ncbi:hypothetical protein EUA06_03035 [Nocardioides glacieisoli]|uniref:Uncharacterized protein n=1 Tax=Nocardioides glacieisoli TaxID=1168730 RepID=A0A4Q2S4R1_9ACTN|nr:hypothetical protein [Nocardioides glacieisoli]RYB96558.1 hypothetical protein EUA06_03035 [Nocardioides glacieisoli]